MRVPNKSKLVGDRHDPQLEAVQRLMAGHGTVRTASKATPTKGIVASGNQRHRSTFAPPTLGRAE
jgi:hypothetical protein